jgi:hypothetical protein
MYDIFYVSTLDKNFNKNWKQFKIEQPVAKYANSFQDAQKKCLTKFFWIVWDDISIKKDFKFDYEPDAWSNEYIHVFKNEDYFDGVCLVPKNAIVTDKEINHRFFVNKKEVNIVASGPKPYDVFEIDSYNEYLSALENSTTEMFWIIPSYVNVSKRFNFNTYFSYNQTYERSINHVYLNGKYHDGIILCSKYSKFSKREFDYRFISHKKEWPVIISKPKPYDLVFISYQEPNADENYNRLLKKYPSAKRVHGVKGIHQAHIAAAKLCNTDMFWIIDGDAVLADNFNFDYQVARWDRETVHVWRSQNPINDLTYGYGGVKLFPRQLTINMDVSKPDITTSISNKFKIVEEISNITAFNTDPFNTWKSAFRECVKLSSKIIDRQKDIETAKRLNIWCTIGKDRLYGEYALDGACAGAIYGEKNQNNIEALKLINDFNWLTEKFNDKNRS